MNYIVEMSSFYNWIMFNPIPADAQALWHALMFFNNKCAVKICDEWYWRVEFTVTNSMLTSVLAFSRQQLDRMRNVLIQSGRIVYRKGKGNQSGTYKFIPFDTSVMESSVENFSEKVWISSVSHNVTQSVTQLDTQMLHKPLHKPDTNEDLCNIFGTLINSNNYNYNNIYNNSLSGGVGDTCACEAQTETVFDEQFYQAVSALFQTYAGRAPTPSDYENAYLHCFRKGKIDRDRAELLEYAFISAHDEGKVTWAYINGILGNLYKRGIKTRAQCDSYDAERDMKKGGLI